MRFLESSIKDQPTITIQSFNFVFKRRKKAAERMRDRERDREKIKPSNFKCETDIDSVAVQKCTFKY